MRLGWVAGAFLALAAGGQPAAADLRGPRELPPAGFTGQQYVDSRGCIFLRGGIGGQVTWVPRIGRDRRQLCGFPPSFSPEPGVAVAAAPQPAPRPTVRRPGDPIDTVASLATPPRLSAAPASPAPARPAAATAAAATPAGVTAGCPGYAPYGARVVLRDGRTALLCVRAPENFPDFARRVLAQTGRPPMPAPQPPAEVVARAGASPVALTPVAAGGIGPVYLADGRILCPAWAPVARAVPLRGGGSTPMCFGAATASAAPAARPAGAARAAEALAKPPAGYRTAWRDDRLNPRRGIGTAEGQAQQDQVWTRQVPARLVADAPRAKAAAAAASQVTASASGARAPAQPAEAGDRFYVQVGSFAVAGNADAARARLAGLGLPVATGRASIKGRPVQVVHAGPFASSSQAQAALAGARAAGFGDAFVR